MGIEITPMSYPCYFKDVLENDDVIAIELRDTPENIFDRFDLMKKRKDILE